MRTNFDWFQRTNRTPMARNCSPGYDEAERICAITAVKPLHGQAAFQCENLITNSHKEIRKRCQKRSK
jgi:hypothetical protein